MQAILTQKGARRLGLHGKSGQVVNVTNLRIMPWNARNVTVITDKHTYNNVHVYTPGHGKDCALILLKS